MKTNRRDTFQKKSANPPINGRYTVMYPYKAIFSGDFPIGRRRSAKLFMKKTEDATKIGARNIPIQPKFAYASALYNELTTPVLEAITPSGLIFSIINALDLTDSYPKSSVKKLGKLCPYKKSISEGKNWSVKI